MNKEEMSREQKKGQSSAHVLLQKASSQLRGERVPLKTREEDELAVSSTFFFFTYNLR